MGPLETLLAVVGPRTWGTIEEESWVVVGITAAVALFSFALHRYWRSVQLQVDHIANRLFEPSKVRVGAASPRPPVPEASTAVLFVEGYDPVGLEALLSIRRMFQGAFSQVIFASVRSFDADDEEGRSDGRTLKKVVETALERYFPVADLLDLGTEVRVALGTNPLRLKLDLAMEIARKYARVVFFCPRILLEPAKWYFRFLEPQGSCTIARRLQQRGLVAVELQIPATVRTKSIPGNFCRA